MRLCLVILASLLCGSESDSQEVLRVIWPTRHASKPVVLSKPAADFLPFFRIATALVPESNIISLALSQPAFLGVPSEDATRLQALCGERYRLIQEDPIFRGVLSSLPYCYSERTPTNGLALVYRPKGTDSNTPCLVFLHGYGGSFLWCQHLLAEAFPDHLIICPAYGISSASLPPAYMSESLTAVQHQLGHPIAPPTLVGLSAGGFGAVRIYTQSPAKFGRLVVLAAYPQQNALNDFGKGMSAYFLTGARESYVQSGLFRHSMQSIRARGAKVEFHVMPGADHYFLLAHREETLKILRSWLR
jgi:pimeloyl-ACP methyl ester carboxylesterase